MKYRVVSITKNVDRYPECRADTAEFPQMIDHVDDEMGLFIVDEFGAFWPAGEFFYMETVTTFTTGD